MPQSPFLEIPAENWIASNELAFAVYDGFPVSPGHALVLAKRPVPTWFEASSDEQAALMSLVNQVKLLLDERLSPRPEGYNVGFNAGAAAGQTVMHVHIHVIPRYSGDMPDPRGGVRHVIPSKGNYLAASSESTREKPGAEQLKLLTGYPQSRLWDQLSLRMFGAKYVEILVSFVQNSGLDLIEQRLFQLLRLQSQVRIMVSDYLSISDPRALRRLLAWQRLVEEEPDYEGELLVRLVEIAKLPDQPQSFHPKSWRIVDSEQSWIAVGSSNLSRPALETGVEWNLLSTSTERIPSHQQFEAEFERLWGFATPLSPAVVAAYSAAATAFRREHFEPETIDQRWVPEPRPWQVAALESLRQIRAAGYKKALVAVATGMGKTWLAAFDIRQVGQELGRCPRVLVIAHRAHILLQAESAFSTMLEASFGETNTSWYIGERSELAGSLVVASIQKLARPEGLERLSLQQFDYVVIDEVHHAEAPTYRRVMAQLSAGFVLGLTATPERGDGVDVATIFDDNLAYYASIGDGIAEETLVPFHYIGLRDTVDFQQIPWRNGRFDLAELEHRVEQSARMQRLWDAMQAHPGQRTLVFCCTRRHALFARNWLRARGYASAAVFSGEGSDGHAESLEGLRSGRLEALCVVDMFNEGLDIPDVDRVVMLRPTESRVIFLQQLGRGLRAAEGKSRLLVIDFVGNHRVFAERILHLLSLGGKEASWSQLREWLDGQPPLLPAGCLLDVELACRDVLSQFLPTGASAALEAYRGLRAELNRRPLARELFAAQVLPGTLSPAAGSWFEFVQSESDLKPQEIEVLERFKAWFKTVETTSLNKSYKLIVLRVLLEHGDLFRGVSLAELSKRCRQSLLNHRVLKRDLTKGQHAVDHLTASDEAWDAWWRTWPIARWLNVQNGERWFRQRGEMFELKIACPEELRTTFEAMTEELVDWRLLAYVKSRRLELPSSAEQAFEAKVSHSGGRAILFLTDRQQFPERPVGLVKVRLPDGGEWEFKFVKVACNVAKPVGTTGNQLSNLLRGWFGANAGLPGTDFRVRFHRQADEWRIEPVVVPYDKVGKSPVAFAFEPADDIKIEAFVSKRSQYRTHVPVYDLVASAGTWGPEGAPEVMGWVKVKGHLLSSGMFAAKVEGRSMEPRIPSGSWCLFRPCPAGSKKGRLLLLQVNTHLDPEDGGRYTIKRYRSEKKRSRDRQDWEHQEVVLEPLNDEFQPIFLRAQDTSEIRVIGEFVAIIHAPRV
jgi:superfamily II DNA or RNA helicase/diadenosine tetraphosphate (Ap4A) HIT family hydrolase/SOS-response transcriptional repressor LexA